jgi:hypothetical protein
MGVRDNQIDWKKKRIYLTPFDLQGLFEDGTSGHLEGAITSGVDQAKIGTSGVVAWAMAAGEFIGGAIPIPFDYDPKHPMLFRVHYSADVSDANATLSWIMSTLFVKKGADIQGAVAALDTVIPLLTPYVNTAGASPNSDRLKQVSGWGIRNGGSLVQDDIDDGALLKMVLELDAVANVTTGWFLGIELAYTPRKTVGFGSDLAAPTEGPIGA